MSKMDGYKPAPGPQSPSKYPFVGKAYQEFGEQTGFIYDPYTDQYYRDPRVTKKQYEDEGLIDKPKAPPGLTDTLLPIAAASGAVYAGKEFGSAIPSYIKEAKGLLSGGEAATGGATSSTAATPAINLAPGADPATGFTLAGGPEAAAPVEAAGAGPLGYAGGALALGAYLSNMYEGGVKDIVKGKGDKRDYTNLFMDINPVTAPINMGLRLAGLPSVGKRLASGKSKAQESRDAGRGLLVNSGVSDSNYNVTLADGSTYGIGADGHAELKNVGKNIDNRETRHAYDVDFSNPLAVAAIPELNLLADKVLGADADSVRKEQLVGQLSNAVTSNAKTPEDVKRNIQAIQAKYSATPPAAPAAAPPVSGQTQPPSTGTLPPRSATRSPGIGLDGRPLPNGGRGLLAGR